jgi:serine/threonine protein kinase
MSPEQIRSSAEVDARTDVWALGIMMFELLSGRLPYPSPDPQTLFVEIATKAPPRLGEVVRGIPQPLAKVVDRCLRHARDERYPSAAELGKDLRRAIASTPELAARLPHLAQADDEFVDRRDLANWTSQSDASTSGGHRAASPVPSVNADGSMPLEIEDSPISRRSSVPEERHSSSGRASSPGRLSPTGSGPYSASGVAPITGAARPRQAATMVVPNRGKKAEESKVSFGSIALVVLVALLMAGLGVLIVFILEPDWLH